jgi:hypothetical protein
LHNRVDGEAERDTESEPFEGAEGYSGFRFREETTLFAEDIQAEIVLEHCGQSGEACKPGVMSAILFPHGTTRGSDRSP